MLRYDGRMLEERYEKQLLMMVKVIYHKKVLLRSQVVSYKKGMWRIFCNQVYSVLKYEDIRQEK